MGSRQHRGLGSCQSAYSACFRRPRHVELRLHASGEKMRRMALTLAAIGIVAAVLTKLPSPQTQPAKTEPVAVAPATKPAAQIPAPAPAPPTPVAAQKIAPPTQSQL